MRAEPGVRLRALPLLALLGCTAGEKAGAPGGGAGLAFPEPAALADDDPADGQFGATLRAAPVTVEVDGVAAALLGYNGGVPGPTIRVGLGDALAMRFENDLPAGEDWGSGVHWHGIEGSNAADGTPLTEAPVPPGGATTYRFRATRPGVFWYHPHVRGAQALFSGLYGPLIVEEPAEAALVEAGVLPAADHVVVLSDTWTVQGRVASAEVDNAMEIMNGTEGPQLLVNGVVRPTLPVPATGGVRLRLINASITRFWRLSVPGHPLVRVGGEGGLLDAARVEGGVAVGALLDPLTGAMGAAVDVPLGYDAGELLLAPGERADVVLRTDGAPGDELALLWRDFARGRHDMWVEDGEMQMGDAEDDGARPDVEVARIQLVETGDPTLELEDGAPLRARVGGAVGALPADGALDWTGAAGTTLDEEMDHIELPDGSFEMTTWFGMNGESWHPDHHGEGLPAEAPSAKRATLGQTIRWEVRNTTAMAHPYHLHGFSYQPTALVRWPDPEGEPGAPAQFLPWTHDEYEDTTLIPGNSSLFFTVHLADPNGDGGGAGRWVQHCHILQHGENGMMSELIVEPAAN